MSDTNLAPLASAEVAILNSAVRILTGANGRFRILALPAGQFALTVRKFGYQSLVREIDMASADTLMLSFLLERSVRELDTVAVIARGRSVRMTEFDQRRATARGQFLSEEEIAKRNPPFATELVRTFVGVNVKMYPGPGSQMQYFAMSSRSGTTDEYKVKIPSGVREQTVQGCPMQVYIDGVTMPTPFSLDLLPPPSHLAGIEMYSGPANTPLQFGGADRRCGVILVWTKDRN